MEGQWIGKVAGDAPGRLILDVDDLVIDMRG